MSALIDAGEAYLKAGRFKLGESCLQRASSQDPKDGGRSAFLLGQCAFHLDDYDNAARAFERAITMGWAQGDIINWQAAAFYEIDKYEEAELCAQKGLEQTDGKSKSLLLSLLGKVHLQRQSLEEAERWFAEGLSADPLCPDVQYGLGLCAIGRGDHNAACGFFEKLLERPDGKPLGHLGLGILCAGGGDTPLAIQHLSEAIRHFLRMRMPGHVWLSACSMPAGLVRQQSILPWLRNGESNSLACFCTVGLPLLRQATLNLPALFERISRSRCG